MKSRVEEVSPAEWDASRRGSDLPNQVGQVIESVKKMRETKRRRGAETRVKRPMERSGGRVGQPVRLKMRDWKEKRERGMKTMGARRECRTRTRTRMLTERRGRGAWNTIQDFRGNEKERK